METRVLRLALVFVNPSNTLAGKLRASLPRSLKPFFFSLLRLCTENHARRRLWTLSNFSGKFTADFAERR
jgi:hypothetical protein